MEIPREGKVLSRSERESDFSAEVLRAASEPSGPVPFERSYWVVPGMFLAGAYPGNPDPDKAEEKLRLFLDAGLRCFVDLTSPEDSNLLGLPLVPYRDLVERAAGGRFDVQYSRMSITDMDVPSQAGMCETLDTIDGALAVGFPTYVHCLGGFGRTGTVVGCWLVRHGIGQGIDVLDIIRKLRRNEPQARWDSPQTEAQRRFILEWKRGK
jgi:hypothetical protein